MAVFMTDLQMKRWQPDQSTIKQQLKMMENGTEAAAVTMALMEAMALLPEDDIVEMNMDHPFYFTISNTQTGLKLFEGCVYNFK